MLCFLGQSMANLAASYGELGRNHDAVELQEKTLEFWQCVLPESHPNIGVM